MSQLVASAQGSPSSARAIHPSLLATFPESAIHPSVLAAYRAFTARFEGVLRFMYLDVKGLVTTGIGNLIDPVESALSLPWKHKEDGRAASPDEIRAEWARVKGHTELKLKGGGAYAKVTSLVLDDAAIDHLVASKLRENEEVLRRRFPGFERWPADAQLGLLSMAWAMGPYFHFPAFEAAVNRSRPDFRAASRRSRMNATGNPGLVPRNLANSVLFTNAAHAVRRGLPAGHLVWPTIAPEELAIGGAVVAGLAIVGLGVAFAYASRQRAAVPEKGKVAA